MDKKHVLYSALILVFTLVVFFPWLSTQQSDFGDILTTFHPRAELLKQSITLYGDFFPLWEPYHLAGEPFLSKGHLGVYYMIGPLLFIAPNTLAALHWNIIINVILAGLFMYLLVFHITKNHHASFISAAIYMFNGFFLTTVKVYSWVAWTDSYALIPLFVYFLKKATQENIIRNAIFAGITLGMMIWGEHGIIFLYSTVVLAIFLAVNLFSSQIKSNATKSILIGALVVLVCFSIAAFKILPEIEEQKYTVRGNLDWNEASTRTQPLPEIFKLLIEPELFNKGAGYKIGIIAFALSIFAIVRKPLNRNVLFFSLIIIVSILLITGSFLLYLFWQYYPSWKGMRYADRAAVPMLFAFAALAGIGASELFSWAKTRIKFPKSESIMAGAIAMLVLANLIVIGSENYDRKFYNAEAAISNNYVLQNVSKMPGIFRIQAFETNGIDFGTEFYTVPLKLENLYGYDTIWNQDYFNFLGYSNINPSKLWGIMNVKYVTSTTPINVFGLRFVEKYKDCKECFTDIPQWNKAWGPYLYENTQFMPRAYIVKDATLIIVDEKVQRNVANQLIVMSTFNPSNSAIIIGKNRVKDYSPEELKKYKAVVIDPNSINKTDTQILKRYANSGGKVFPDALNGNKQLTVEEISSFMDTLGNKQISVPDSNVITHSFDSKEIQLDGETEGFLIISEKYSMFPGWTAKADGKETEILKANGPISAVYINKGTKKVLFEYKPKSFTTGSIITITALIALAAYFTFHLIKRQRKKTN